MYYSVQPRDNSEIIDVTVIDYKPHPQFAVKTLNEILMGVWGNQEFVIHVEGQTIETIATKIRSRFERRYNLLERVVDDVRQLLSEKPTLRNKVRFLYANIMASLKYKDKEHARQDRETDSLLQADSLQEIELRRMDENS